MSAQESGRRLLARIEQPKGLDEVLRLLVQLSKDEKVSNQQFGIPVIDRLSHTTQLKKYRRDASSPIHSDDISHDPNSAQHSLSLRIPKSRHPTVLELSSSHHAAGKTHLVYLLTAIAVLPKRHGDSFIGGKGSAVILLDVDARLHVPRLVTVMRTFIRERWNQVVDESGLAERRDGGAGPFANLPEKAQRQEHYYSTDDEDAEEVQNHGNVGTVMEEPKQAVRASLDEATLDHVIVTALQHVHIFRPTSFEAVTDVLNGLKDYVFSAAAYKSSHRCISSIVVDSGDAFYWQYRAEQDAQSRHLTVSTSYTHMVERLRELATTFSCAVIVTSTEGNYGFAGRRNPSDDRGEPRSFLPAPWSTFTTLRFHMSRDNVTRFAPAISVEQSLRERAERQKVVDRGRFSARLAGDDEGFGFSIAAGGIMIDGMYG